MLGLLGCCAVHASAGRSATVTVNAQRVLADPVRRSARVPATRGGSRLKLLPAEVFGPTAAPECVKEQRLVRFDLLGTEVREIPGQGRERSLPPRRCRVVKAPDHVPADPLGAEPASAPEPESEPPLAGELSPPARGLTLPFDVCTLSVRPPPASQEVAYHRRVAGATDPFVTGGCLAKGRGSSSDAPPRRLGTPPSALKSPP